MIDLTKVRNYYIACGYTDLRLGIDGLAAVVTQQYGSHLDEESLFLFCGRRTDRTLGRKNWLFCDTTKRAEAGAIVYSLVESAKANGVEPFAYLQHVLVELPYLGKNQSHEELESFMPWAPYIQQEFGVKDSDAYVNTYLD